MISPSQPWGRLVINLGYRGPGLGAKDPGISLPAGALNGSLLHLLRAVRLNEVRPLRRNAPQFPSLGRLTLAEAVTRVSIFLARIIVAAFHGLEAVPAWWTAIGLSEAGFAALHDRIFGFPTSLLHCATQLWCTRRTIGMIRPTTPPAYPQGVANLVGRSQKGR